MRKKAAVYIDKAKEWTDKKNEIKAIKNNPWQPVPQFKKGFEEVKQEKSNTFIKPLQLCLVIDAS